MYFEFKMWRTDVTDSNIVQIHVHVRDEVKNFGEKALPLFPLSILNLIFTICDTCEI